MDWLFDAGASEFSSLSVTYPELDDGYAMSELQKDESNYLVPFDKEESTTWTLYSAPRDTAYPTGCVAYGDGGYYMRCPDGSIRLTPQWQNQVDSGETNWGGIAADFAIIIGSGVSILGVWGAAVGGVIVAGADAVREMADSQRDLDGGSGVTGDDR